MTQTRILIVDDESTLRTTMADLLDNDQREIIAAASGEEALAYLEDGSFDLIVVDLCGVTGYFAFGELPNFHSIFFVFRCCPHNIS